MTLPIVVLFVCQTAPPVSGQAVRQIEARAFELRQSRGSAEAEAAFKEAVQAAEATGDPLLLTHALHYWSLSLRELRNFEAAEQAQRRAIQLLEDRIRSKDRDAVLPAAQALTSLAVALVATERIAEAEPLLRRALILCGKDPYTRAWVLNVSAELEYRNGNDRVAERQVQEALQAHSRIQGNRPDRETLAHHLSLTHVYRLLLAWIHNTAGLIAYRAFRIEEAEAHWRKSARMYREVEPSGWAAIAGPQANLSELLRFRKRYKEAAEMAAQALELYDTALGPGSLRSAFALRLLGSIHTDMGEYNQARSLLNRAFDIASNRNGPRDAFVASVLSGLGDLESKEKHFIEAERLYRQAIQVIEETKGRDHPLLLPTLQGYADLLRKLKRREEARAVDLRAMNIQIAVQAGAGSTVSLQSLRAQAVR